MRVLRPLTGKVTYRRWVYFVLGGAMSVPYLLFAVLAIPSLLPTGVSMGGAVVIGTTLTVVVAVGTAFLPVVRVLESAAVRELLDDPVPGSPAHPGSLGGRVRAAGMFLLHVGTGCVLSLASLLAPTFFGFAVSAVFTGRLFQTSAGDVIVPRGWASAWLPLAVGVGVVALIYVVWAAGAGLRRVAVKLLGMSAADRLEQLERRTGQLAERNRLARELHDSVGHALSVVTVQAAAARRTLGTDPEFTGQALEAIEESARTALADLDHVLGLLREEAAGRAPQLGLADLPALVASTRHAGTDLHADVRGDVSAVPAVVSREVYRILQECLTNAVRYAGRVPVTMGVEIDRAALTAKVTNPLGDAAKPARAGGGRGLRGMAERAAVLGGELSAGPAGPEWEVVVRVPWGSR